MEQHHALTPLGMTARMLHVPPAWLRAEAEAGRIPHLRAGKAILFDVTAVERLLLKRMAASTAIVGEVVNA